MSSDNPFDQVEALIASDERQQLPEAVEGVLKGIARLPHLQRKKNPGLLPPSCHPLRLNLHHSDLSTRLGGRSEPVTKCGTR